MLEAIEIIKTIEFEIEGFDGPVVGNVFKQIIPRGRQIYGWRVSHHYKPTSTAVGFYRPSKVSADSANAAEELLIGYMQSFTAEFEVVEN